MYNKTPLCSTLAEVEALFNNQRTIVFEITNSTHDTASTTPEVLLIDSSNALYCGKCNFVTMSLIAKNSHPGYYIQIAKHVAGKESVIATRYDISSACDMYEKMLNEVTALGRFCDFLTGFEPVIEENNYICVVPGNLSEGETHKAWEMYQMLFKDALQTAAQMMLPISCDEYLPLYKIKRELPLPALYAEVIDEVTVQWKLIFDGGPSIDVPEIACDKTYVHIEYEVNQVLFGDKQKNDKEGEVRFDEIIGAIVLNKNGYQYSFSIREIEKMYVLRESKDYMDEFSAELSHHAIPKGKDKTFFEAVRSIYVKLRKNGMRKDDAYAQANRDVLFKTTGKYYADEYDSDPAAAENIKFAKLDGIEIATGPCTTDTLTWEEVDKVLAVASKL